MSSSPPLQCRRVSLHRRKTFSDQFEPATFVVIAPPFPTLTTQPLQLKLTVYPPRRAPSLMDLNSRPPLEPPDPPDRATSSQSKTFTVIVPFFPLELVLVDSKNLLVLSVSHSLLAYACHFVNLLVSTILKPRTLEVFVVLLDGLNFSPESGLESLHLFLSQQFMSIRRPKVGLHSSDQICSLKGREDNHPPATSLFPAPSFPSPMSGLRLKIHAINHRKHTLSHNYF
ncbi:hypothetical protein Bca101_001671 [Brassica carinata]